MAIAVASRLAALPGSHEGNMSPDAAHFLNVARCMSRGEGFSNPAAWPAWLKPERLPAPETFKDPGFPLAIALLTPLARDPFRAGQWISLLAGVLLPLAVIALGRRITRDRAVAVVAGAIVAGSPVLIAQSVRVMSESLFTLLVTLAFVAAAPGDRDAPARGRAQPGGLAAGAWLGLAFLVRTQALVAVPALVLVTLAGRPGPAGWTAAWRALVAMTAVGAPLMIRNLVTFGAPFHSDAATFAVWPFVDPIAFSHALDRPPAPLAFLLAHAPDVLGHTARALLRFARALPGEFLGSVAWLPALAAGAAVSIARPRTWAFAWVYLVPVVLMMAAVSWNTRYFASTAPFWCLITGLGAAWILQRLPSAWRSPAARAAAVAALLVVAGFATARVIREVRVSIDPEIAAAAAESPILASRLARDEALMAVTTSYWSWFSERRSVHLVIADEPAFMEVVRRHRVRWAALPTSRLEELAARYPDGRLPRALVRDHADPARDVTVFVVRDRP